MINRTSKPVIFMMLAVLAFFTLGMCIIPQPAIADDAPGGIDPPNPPPDPPPPGDTSAPSDSTGTDDGSMTSQDTYEGSWIDQLIDLIL
jgi:hypothetical protein